MNERITENIVRKKLQSFGTEGVLIEEQKSRHPRISKLLRGASKSGEGIGKPEFIISFSERPDFLIVIECKADLAKHQSKDRAQYKEFAVDGALLYASYLSKGFDVLAIAVSGQDEQELKINHFLQLKGKQSKELATKSFLTKLEYLALYTHDEDVLNQEYDKLLQYTKELNSKLHTAKILAGNRSFLISGILIALNNQAFKSSYKKHDTAQNLANNLVQTITGELRKSSKENLKIDTLRTSYNFIKTDRKLTTDKEFFIALINEVNDHINSFIKTYEYYDIIGEFYIEFLRYANNEKGLGIVLTPKHITELFSEIARVNKKSIVFDNCCGTGGFLISAMRKMIEEADSNIEKRRIKEKQIIGMEIQNNIYALACSNMIIHDDGKTNLYLADCFDASTEAKAKNLKPTIGLLNPPYKADKKNDTEELKFVLNNLECLEHNGICVALLPMRCALYQKSEGLEIKERLLKSHTLEAVMSMPIELFHNSKVGVSTCVMVFRAHQPHTKWQKTYFGYWKDDGFIKRKIEGRIDGGQYSEIKQRWLSSFFSKEEIPGLSVMQVVSAENEWCAEAYMETDYSMLTEIDFVRALKEYIAFQFLEDKI